MRGHAKFPILRKGKSYEFKADDGHTISLMTEDASGRTWFMAHGSTLLRVPKSLNPSAIVNGVSYFYAPKPRHIVERIPTLNGDALEGDSQKISKEAAKLKDVASKILSEMTGSRLGERFRMSLVDGYYISIQLPPAMSRYNRAAAKAV